MSASNYAEFNLSNAPSPTYADVNTDEAVLSVAELPVATKRPVSAVIPGAASRPPVANQAGARNWNEEYQVRCSLQHCTNSYGTVTQIAMAMDASSQENRKNKVRLELCVRVCECVWCGR